MGAARFKTKYPGVFYRLARRLGGPGEERVYYVRFVRQGEICEEKVGRQFADGMTEAKAARIRADLIEGRRPLRRETREERGKPVWTVGALWEDYCRAFPDKKGLYNDRNRFKTHLAPTLAEKRPEELIPLDVDRLRISLSKTHAPATVAKVLELLRRTINHGVRRGLVEPLKFRITLPRVNNLRTEDLNAEELSRLLRAIDEDPDRDAADVMRLALATGMRRGEILRLRWENLDFDRGLIRLVEPKGGRDAVIPMNAAARAVLEARPRTDSPWVFPGRRGGHLQDPRAGIRRIAARAGLPPGFRPLHGLRHVFASTLASSGAVDLYTLQKLLTHKSPAMTQRYAHLRDAALRRASELAGRLLAAPAPPAEEARENG